MFSFLGHVDNEWRRSVVKLINVLSLDGYSVPLFDVLLNIFRESEEHVGVPPRRGIDIRGHYTVSVGEVGHARMPHSHITDTDATLGLRALNWWPDLGAFNQAGLLDPP